MSGLDTVLLRGLSAIEPYLGDVVLAGGWVPHVYEVLRGTTAANRAPRTFDIDLAVRRSVPVKDKSIDCLLVEAGFACEFHSLDTPPVTKYVATGDGDGVEIEFITDAPGSAEAAIYVQPDLTAQELHYVGLLLKDPWPVNLEELTSGEVSYAVLIPNPGAFVFHKALMFKDRVDRLKREKDLYYIFFVLDAFPEWNSIIARDFAEFAVQHPTWFKKCRRNLAALFDAPDSEGVDALLNQRPAMAYTGMTDEQFRQYAFSVMSEVIARMDSALARES